LALNMYLLSLDLKKSIPTTKTPAIYPDYFFFIGHFSGP
jgi:hypothetical protein